MPELRQLHLQFALETARPLRKYIQNEARPVEHAAFQDLLQIALMAGAPACTADPELGLILVDTLLKVSQLAFADKIA